jgi:hypothetical protein
MFDRLSAEPPSHRMEPLPGLLARKARTRPAAREVVAALPSGPAERSVAGEGMAS